MADNSVHNLQNLSCGSNYEMYVTAVNNVGTGEPGPIIKVKTKGKGNLHSLIYLFQLGVITFAICVHGCARF